MPTSSSKPPLSKTSTKTCSFKKGSAFYGSATSTQGNQAETNFQQDFTDDQVIGALAQEQKPFL